MKIICLLYVLTLLKTAIFREKNGVVVQIQNIVVNDCNDTFFIVKQFENYAPLYNYPCSSQEFNISVVKQLSENISIISVSDLAAKCMVFPMLGDESAFASFPLLHTYFNS